MKKVVVNMTDNRWCSKVKALAKHSGRSYAIVKDEDIEEFLRVMKADKSLKTKNVLPGSTEVERRIIEKLDIGYEAFRIEYLEGKRINPTDGVKQTGTKNEEFPSEAIHGKLPKRCAMCGEVKPIGEYWPMWKNGTKYLQGYCKECLKSYHEMYSRMRKVSERAALKCDAPGRKEWKDAYIELAQEQLDTEQNYDEAERQASGSGVLPRTRW